MQPDCKPEYLKKLYREKDRSQQFIDRCLFIADIYLRYLADNSSNTSAQSFYTQQDFTPASIIRDIHPDFVILRGKEDTQHFALYQLFPEGTPRYAVRKRIEQYITFLTEGEGIDLSLIHIFTNTFEFIRMTWINFSSIGPFRIIIIIYCIV